MMQLFRLMFTGIFLVLFSLQAFARDTPVVLTVYGEITNTNRSGSDPFFDGFLNHHDRTFEKAFEFTLDELAKLKQYEIMINSEGWANAVKASGPSLSDVLAKSGAVNANITVMALDGYAVEFSDSEIKSQNWILAMNANGKPLSIGGRGPLWLTYNTDTGTATSDEEAKWVWSVFVIEVRK